MSKQCPHEAADESSSPKPEGWLKQAISDENNQVDMAYIVIGILATSAVAALSYVLVMATISYLRCTKIVDVGQGIKAALNCVFDPLPIGQSAGLIFTAFAALIGAFAGYMAATRRRTKEK